MNTTRDISTLKNWDKNPRSIKKKDFERLKKQIQTLGQYKPLLITEDGTVLGGNMRLRAYIDLGITDIWVSIVDAPTEDKKLEYALSDNDRAGFYDSDLLANIIPEYPDFDWSQYAVDLREPESLKEILDQFKEMREDPQVLIEEKALSKLGEVYQLGSHRLICGDATNRDIIDTLMQNDKAQIIFTDPPYNVDYSYDWRSDLHKGKKVSHHFFSDKKTDKEYVAFLTAILTNGYQVTEDSASIYCWYGMKHHRFVEEALVNAGFLVSQILFWVKNYPVLSPGQAYHRVNEPCMFGWKKGKKNFYNKISTYRDFINWDEMDYLFDLWFEKRDNLKDYIHPTQKPIRLAERALKKSTRENDIVLDFFGGSGSTLIACEQMGRQARLVELDPLYCDVIRKRYDNFIANRKTTGV